MIPPAPAVRQIIKKKRFNNSLQIYCQFFLTELVLSSAFSIPGRALRGSRAIRAVGCPQSAWPELWGRTLGHSQAGAGSHCVRAPQAPDCWVFANLEGAYLEWTNKGIGWNSNAWQPLIWLLSIGWQICLGAGEKQNMVKPTRACLSPRAFASACFRLCLPCRLCCWVQSWL